MIHPHHDLLVPAGVINPNFIPPHPLFLPQYPFTVGMEVPTTTAKTVKARSREIQAARTASASRSERAFIAHPQAVKPLVVGSVLSAESSTEKPVLDLNATASAVEGAESETTVGKANEQKPLQVETTTAQPPSSSVQPVEITTTPCQNGAVNEGQINLIKHLNTSDLESFLHSANLSTNEAQTFLKLVEKVLEGELQNRLQRRNDPETSTNPATNSTVRNTFNCLA
ncbi:hypothetical protein M3Y99_00397400 [Aphelenchoides fujianensis]|nr:hypothetical protein M3Y99_00397400 [Aphelenchoides fujianensis]